MGSIFACVCLCWREWKCVCESECIGDTSFWLPASWRFQSFSIKNLRPPFHRPFIESCYSRATMKSNFISLSFFSTFFSSFTFFLWLSSSFFFLSSSFFVFFRPSSYYFVFFRLSSHFFVFLRPSSTFFVFLRPSSHSFGFLRFSSPSFAFPRLPPLFSLHSSSFFVSHPKNSIYSFRETWFLSLYIWLLSLKPSLLEVGFPSVLRACFTRVDIKC